MANNKDDNNKIRCSFCGKTQDQVRRIVAGPGAYICNECVSAQLMKSTFSVTVGRSQGVRG